MSLKPFFQQAQREFDRQQQIANMTRQEAFEAGLLTVQDLDDEELRAGRCRNPSGIIPRSLTKTEPIPKDLHDEIVAEHEARWNTKLREQLDIMTDVLIGVATNPAAEDRDRMDAAKYVIERVAGKTPDRVQVAVAKAPWEEMVTGIARGLTRVESQRRRGIIDAESEEVENDGSVDGEARTVVDVDHVDLVGGPQTGAPSTEAPVSPSSTPAQSDASLLGRCRLCGNLCDGVNHIWTGTTGDLDVEVPDTLRQSDTPGVDVLGGRPLPTRAEYDPEQIANLESPEGRVANMLGSQPPSAYGPAEVAPTFDNPANSSSTIPAQALADALATQKDLVERRKQRKAELAARKKKKIIQRTLGVDAFPAGMDITVDTTALDETGEGRITFGLE